MAVFGKEKRVRTYLYTKPAVAVLALVALLLGYAVVERYRIYAEIVARRQAAEVTKAEALERKASLEQKVEYLEGERGIEEEIRKHFDVARDGEKVVILVGEGEPEVATSSESIPTPAYPWYQFWR